MKNDLAKHDLRGRVKSVRTELKKLEEQDGRRVEQPWYAHTMVFDRIGNMTEHVHHNPDGSEPRTLNEYSDDGRLLATKNYDASGHEVGEGIYDYDAHGRLVAERHTSLDIAGHAPDAHTEISLSGQSSFYTYDAQGLKTETQELNYPSGGGLIIGIKGTETSIAVHDAKRIVTAYDERDDAVDVKVYNAEGALTGRVEIVRDAGSKPLELTMYLGDTVSFEPSSTGDCPPGEFADEEAAVEAQPEITEEQRAELEAEVARTFAPGAPMGKTVYVYDVANRLIESKSTMMGMVINHEKRTYDDAGNKHESITYDEHGALRSRTIFTRTYDEHGNWTEEIVSSASAWDAEFNLSTPQHVTRRAIIYHED